MFHSYVSGVENAPPPSCIPVENAPPPSCIPEENAPPPSCIRTQCWSRGMRYKKSGRHYSCKGRVSREGQCEMLARIKNGMRNALKIHKERIATHQLTCLQATMFHSYVSAVENAPPPSCIPIENAPPTFCIPDVPLLRLRSRECSTAILYTSRECSTAILYTSRESSTAILYTRRECSTAIVYTYPVLEPGDAL